METYSMASGHIKDPLDKTIYKMKKILKSLPFGAHADNTTMWKKMVPMTVDLFEQGWQLVEKSAPIFDLANAKYEEWQDGQGWHNQGLRHVISQ